jgi:hypothetical protein
MPLAASDGRLPDENRNFDTFAEVEDYLMKRGSAWTCPWTSNTDYKFMPL